MSNRVCKVYKQCGGCQYQGIDYQKQLRLKQDFVTNTLKQFCVVESIIPMESPLHYRCKAQIAFGQSRNGIISGPYQVSSHRIVDTDDCLIVNEKANIIFAAIKKLMIKFNIKPYNDVTREGCIRHVLIRYGYNSNEILIAIVTGSFLFPSKKEFIRQLLIEFPEITTIVQNINKKFTSLVLGDTNIILHGRGYIYDYCLGYKFRISPQSFYQVNPIMTEKLFSTAINLLSLTGHERILDAYCGTGTIGILASSKALQVTGVELNPDAIKDAKTNASINNISNISFISADASDYIYNAKKKNNYYDVVIMDPPRSGSTDIFIKNVCLLKPKKVCYISCNPTTLASDLKIFSSFGYYANIAIPFDMFPYTQHVETVVMMSKNKG